MIDGAGFEPFRQPHADVEIIELQRHEDRIEHRSQLGPEQAIGPETQFSGNCRTSKSPLGPVVVHRNAGIVEEDCQSVTMVEQRPQWFHLRIRLLSAVGILFDRLEQAVETVFGSLEQVIQVLFVILFCMRDLIVCRSLCDLLEPRRQVLFGLFEQGVTGFCQMRLGGIEGGALVLEVLAGS